MVKSSLSTTTSPWQQASNVPIEATLWLLRFCDPISIPRVWRTRAVHQASNPAKTTSSSHAQRLTYCTNLARKHTCPPGFPIQSAQAMPGNLTYKIANFFALPTITSMFSVTWCSILRIFTLNYAIWKISRFFQGYGSETALYENGHFV